jgi:hypothetical protein
LAGLENLVSEVEPQEFCIKVERKFLKKYVKNFLLEEENFLLSKHNYFLYIVNFPSYDHLKTF